MDAFLLPSPRERSEWRGGVGGGGRHEHGASVVPPPRPRSLRSRGRPSPPTGGRGRESPLGVRAHDQTRRCGHGRPGEDGTIQGLLEVLAIPYSHSGVLASALAMQKDRAKVVMRDAGVPVPDGMVVSRADAAKAHVLERPYVIKPIAEGSSVGVFLVTEAHAHPPQELTRPDWQFGEFLLAERYVAGKELTCAVMGDKALDVIE